MSEKFSYKDPYFLNKLALHIAGEKCSLTARLMPDVDEFIERARKTDKKKQRESLIEVLRLCDRHRIKPFWTLRFKRDNHSEIKYCGPENFGELMSSGIYEPHETLSHPLIVIQNTRWHEIIFEDIKGEWVKKAQEAIYQSINGGYRVVSLTSHLRPRIVRGVENDYEDSEASIFAYDGNLSYHGNLPEGFGREIDRLKMPELKYEDILESSANQVEALMKKLERGVV